MVELHVPTSASLRVVLADAFVRVCALVPKDFLIFMGLNLLQTRAHLSWQFLPTRILPATNLGWHTAMLEEWGKPFEHLEMREKFE